MSVFCGNVRSVENCEMLKIIEIVLQISKYFQHFRSSKSITAIHCKLILNPSKSCRCKTQKSKGVPKFHKIVKIRKYENTKWKEHKHKAQSTERKLLVNWRRSAVCLRNDERRTTNDERRTTNDERRTTNDERRTTVVATDAGKVVHEAAFGSVMCLVVLTLLQPWQ